MNWPHRNVSEIWGETVSGNVKIVPTYWNIGLHFKDVELCDCAERGTESRSSFLSHQV